MGRRSRLKATRRADPPPLPKPMPKGRKTVFTITLALSLVVVVVAGFLVLTRKPTPVTPPATFVSAADKNAPASLLAAAHAVGFLPTTEPGVGRLETKPASAANPPANAHLLGLGTTAPPFTLKTPTGQQVSLAEFRGKATLLEFFATWCPHCNAEAPHIRALSTSLPSAKYGFVSVNADGETAPSVFAFHLYYGFTFPALLDPSSHPGDFHSPGAAGPVSTAYRVESFPTFYVIDPKGKIAWASDGEQPDALLREQLVSAARA